MCLNACPFACHAHAGLVEAHVGAAYPAWTRYRHTFSRDGCMLRFPADTPGIASSACPEHARSDVDHGRKASADSATPHGQQVCVDTGTSFWATSRAFKEASSSAATPSANRRQASRHGREKLAPRNQRWRRIRSPNRRAAAIPPDRAGGGGRAVSKELVYEFHPKALARVRGANPVSM